VEVNAGWLDVVWVQRRNDDASFREFFFDAPVA